MIARLRARLQEWILGDLVVCPQCRCLVDRHHGSAACGRFLRDTVQTLQATSRDQCGRLRLMAERQNDQAGQILALQAAADDQE